MKTATEFLWGTPAEVAARVRSGVPSFRLVNPAGDLPVTNRLFALPTGSTAAKMAAAHAGGSQLAATATPKALVRAGRTVGLVWEDAHAVYCSLAGVLPPDLAAPRGAQAAAIFPEMEALLAEAGMTFANVVRTWLYIDRVCEWYGEFNAARSAFFESRNVFNTFLPASTGIGSANLDGAAITAGAIAMKPKDASVHAEIVESPLQAPAMAYRSSFSRAAEIHREAGGLHDEGRVRDPREPRLRLGGRLPRDRVPEGAVVPRGVAGLAGRARPARRLRRRDGLRRLPRRMALRD